MTAVRLTHFTKAKRFQGNKRRVSALRDGQEQKEKEDKLFQINFGMQLNVRHRLSE